MNENEEYNWFIDQFVELGKSDLTVQRILEHGHAERTNTYEIELSQEESERKQLLLSMNAVERQILVSMLKEQRAAALYDTLTHLEDAVSECSISLSVQDVDIDESSYASFDNAFAYRMEDEPWPEGDGPNS